MFPLIRIFTISLLFHDSVMEFLNDGGFWKKSLIRMSMLVVTLRATRRILF